MDQTTVVVNATEEFLRDSLTKATLRVTELEEHIQKVTQRSYADSADRNRMVEGMQEWTLEAVEDGSITESQAEEIAEIMGFELTKEDLIQYENEIQTLFENVKKNFGQIKGLGAKWRNSNWL